MLLLKGSKQGCCLDREAVSVLERVLLQLEDCVCACAGDFLSLQAKGEEKDFTVCVVHDCCV